MIPNKSSQHAVDFSYETISKLIEYGNSVFIPNEYTSLYSGTVPDVVFSDMPDIMDKISIVITVGGDGTILKNAPLANEADIPVLGINAGYSGFICSLEEDELDELKRLTSGDYSIEERMMLSVRVVSKNGIVEETALNDVIFSSAEGAYITSFSVSCNGKPVDEFIGDGLVFSTPTGSTGYNLAAGSIICDPVLSLIYLTPLCPHALSQRSMIFKSDDVFEIKRSSAKDNGDKMLSIDGRKRIKLEDGTIVRISRSDTVTRLVNFGKISFFEKAKKKLTR